MPDPRIMIVGSALDAQEAASRLADLKRVSLPNAAKFLVTRGKFDTEKAATNFNIDSGYPAEIAKLQSLAAASGQVLRDDPRFRDGYDLFCIRRLIEKHGGYDLLLLLRDLDELQERWSAILDGASAGLFVSDGKNLLLNLAELRCARFVDLAWTTYRTGAAYAIVPYAFPEALSIVEDALDAAAAVEVVTAA